MIELLVILAGFIASDWNDHNKNNEDEKKDDEKSFTKFSSGYDYERNVYWTLRQNYTIKN